MSHDIKRLPVWAQDDIQHLRGRVARLERDLDRATSANRGASKVDMWDSERHVSLPDERHFRFKLGARLNSYVDVRVRETTLHIQAGDCIRVLPRAYNAVDVVMDKEETNNA